MHRLTRDVGIFIVLTVKIVVQSDVATDAYSSELFATPCTSASHKAEARKMKRQLHSKMHLLTLDAVGKLALTAMTVVQLDVARD